MGLRLQFLEEQTPELCLEAVREDAKAVMFAKNLTTELKMKMYEVNPQVIEYLAF